MSNLDNPIIAESFEQLRQKGMLLQEQIEQFNNLAVQLDEKYFAIQDKAENNTALEADALRFFRQARAVSALSRIPKLSGRKRS